MNYKKEKTEEKTEEKTVKIMERDLEMMRWILEQKFMTEKQLRKVFWKDRLRDNREAYRRFNQLRKAGFLKANRTRVGEGMMYLVTAKAVEELKRSNRNSGLVELDDVGYSNYKHDLGVTDIRILFHGWGYKEWLSERVLCKRGGLRRMPDGMVFNRERYLAIEYEASIKSKQRYREIFYSYEMDRQVNRVLYVVDKSEHILRITKDAPKCGKLHFASMGDIQAKQEGAVLKGASGQYSLGEFLGGGAWTP
jgi:hypothetical protein